MGKRFRQNQRWVNIIFLCLITTNSLAVQPNTSKQNTYVDLTAKTAIKEFPQFVLDGFKDAERTFFEPNNLVILLMAAGGSIALHDRTDDRAARHFSQHEGLPEFWDKTMYWVGSPAVHFGAAGLWYAMAEEDDQLNRGQAWTMLKALSVTGATTLLLKGINQNHSPNGSILAWPSGHTSSSVCVAAVLDEFYGPKVGVPAYALAGFVGYRMMDSGDHWASDVLFGAVLGYVIGHSIAGEHKKLEVAGFDVLPYTSANGTGVSFVKQF